MKSIELIGDASGMGGPAVRTFAHDGARYYVAAKGDTYWSIASDELGSAALADELWHVQSEDFRRAHGGSMNRLAAGDVLRLPEEQGTMNAISFSQFYAGGIGFLGATSDNPGAVSIPEITITGNPNAPASADYSAATQTAANALVDYLFTHEYQEREKVPQVGTFQRAYMQDGGSLPYGADKEYGPATHQALQNVLDSMGGGAAPPNPAVTPQGGGGGTPAHKMPWGAIAAVGGGLLAVGGIGYGVHRMMRK